MPTWRRPHLLERCLHALMRQHLAPERYEIIVCDDGPDEATRNLTSVLAAVGARRGLMVAYLPVTGTQGPAAARNRGWRLARGALVAFTDDDTIPDPGWLKAGIAAMRARPLAALSGAIVMPLRPQPTDYERDAAGLATAEFATANCFVRRAVLEAVGGFDERYTAAWREDSDLHFAILRTGGKIGRAHEAIVVHPVRPARWGVSLGQARKSQFDALLYRKYPAEYRARIGAPPWRYYAIVLSAIVAIGASIAGAWLAGAAALAVWGALTASFAARRLRDTSRRPLHVAEMIVTSIAIPPLAIAWRLIGALRFRARFL